MILQLFTSSLSFLHPFSPGPCIHLASCIPIFFSFSQVLRDRETGNLHCGDRM